MKVAAIVPAAGSGKRLGSKTPKPFVRLSGKPLLVHTLQSLKKSFTFSEIILAVHPRQMQSARRLLARNRLGAVQVVAGGKTRSESVRNAAVSASKHSQWLLVHDAARPFLTQALVQRLLAAARRTGAAICALPATATVKKVKIKSLIVRGTLNREEIFLAQTPQVFRKKVLLDRYRRLGAGALRFTDEAALFDGSGVDIKVVPGDAKNIKITTRADKDLAEFYLKKRKGL